ncbi:hypothetical protein [Clostridium grantii]|uniref:HesB-like selenoprotein n=1 Tax=Clostridium grantii DSM 8605 TaxID=1121316 RepID=A0A1M5XSU9_9CLOT|nr:hypothetical protein [Clostridium grantii]SHI02829.1 hypothetical protein SAMN02745207_03903 [Clostridium grantii DSM 8605]
MEKEVFENHGDIKIEFMGTGFKVAPTNQSEDACGSCGGSCS